MRKEDGLACYANRQEPLQQVVVSANKYISLKEAFAEKGLPFVAESFTNQQFPILTEKMYETLTKKYGIGSWEVFDNGTRAVRFCTSWATSEEQVHNLINDLKAL